MRKTLACLQKTVLAAALVAVPLAAQTPADPVTPGGPMTTNTVDDDDDFNWGWLGLVGLAGLLGLRRHSHRDVTGARTTDRV
ncbi:MAG: WGxxGxxG family protein [Bryobacteraceae bacterium]|nr:WGxxGxxG family protein [Bryobacteraceae bacterium]